MKKIYAFLLLAAFSIQFLGAQKVVKLEIEHLLGSDPFAFGANASNNLGQDFNVSRLQYYIAEIRLEHDGGTITPINDFWILANAGEISFYDLGSLPITSLEAIHFAIGVDSAHNHSDPASYPSGHPLAPQSPSMHWGWISGYRFLTLEGMKGGALDEVYEIHSLFDKRYYTQRIPTAGTEIDGELWVTLKGDYTRILENIDLDGSVIDHGDFPRNVASLQNMHDYVFTSIEGNGNTNVLGTGIDAVKKEGAVSIFPNPIANGQFSIQLDAATSQNYQVEIRNMLGTVVEVHALSGQKGVQTIQTNVSSGAYLVVMKQGVAVHSTHRIVVTN